MKNLTLILAAFALLALGAARAEGNNRLGVGANYWMVIDDIESDVDDDGFSYLASYQHRGGLLGVELAAEFFPDRFGQDAWAPQAYIILGSGIYVAAGAGMLSIDGEWADDPFYALKAGLNFEILPSLYLDISANYRFSEKEQLEDDSSDIDTDTVFLGAAARLGF
jgi:hypothetical protein